MAVLLCYKHTCILVLLLYHVVLDFDFELVYCRQVVLSVVLAMWRLLRRAVRGLREREPARERELAAAPLLASRNREPAMYVHASASHRNSHLSTPTNHIRSMYHCPPTLTPYRII